MSCRIHKSCQCSENGLVKKAWTLAEMSAKNLTQLCRRRLVAVAIAFDKERIGIRKSSSRMFSAAASRFRVCHLLLGSYQLIIISARLERGCPPRAFL